MVSELYFIHYGKEIFIFSKTRAGFGAHLAFYQVGIGEFFPIVKGPGCEADH